jgi:hypothetical protein
MQPHAPAFAGEGAEWTVGRHHASLGGGAQPLGDLLGSGAGPPQRLARAHAAIGERSGLCIQCRDEGESAEQRSRWPAPHIIRTSVRTWRPDA